ncbi:MAG: zf-HC2 domain-containing protein [Planctomycetota bacterium]
MNKENHRVREAGCRLTRRRLSAFLDGEVDRETSRQVGQHLLQCAGCAEHLESLSAVSAVAHELMGGPERIGSIRTPPRFASIVRRLSESRQLLLEEVLNHVMAKKLLRLLGVADSFEQGAETESLLIERARSLVRELRGLDGHGERVRLASLEGLLEGGSYEDLRAAGLLDPPPPPAPAEGDEQARMRALHWVQDILRSPE